MDGRRGAIFGITFVVAFCSFVYELAYSEFMTVVFGGTVLRYSLTIGLFFFAFGLGSILYNKLDSSPEDFFVVELLLSVVGPLGLVAIILLNSFPSSDFFLFNWPFPIVLSHLPIVAIGLLSGLEIPYLSSLTEEGNDGFSLVLGVDYFGGLVASLVYALYMYPELGLLTTVFTLGFLNAIVALAYGLYFSNKGRILLIAVLVVTAGFGGVLTMNGAVEEDVTNFYLSNQYESEYSSGNMDISVTDRKRTPYTRAVTYNRTWTGSPDVGLPKGEKEKCLRMDSMLQLCESWVNPYHNGLVDVPMTAFDNTSEVNVLVLGGGDWIAIEELRKYNVSIDHVDVDGEFQQYSKEKDFITQYNNQSWEYDKLNSVDGDAFSYLRETNEKYDLILSDLPGIRNDDLLKLYSTEFYSLMNQHLTDRGMVVSWTYNRYSSPTHRKVYLNTVGEAGFESHMQYHARGDYDNDGEQESGESYYIFSPKESPGQELEIGNSSQSKYIRNNQQAYEDLHWRFLPQFRGVEVNSIFDPNYDIIVDI